MGNKIMVIAETIVRVREIFTVFEYRNEVVQNLGTT